MYYAYSCYVRSINHVIGNPRFQYKNERTVKEIGRSAINNIMEFAVLQH